MFVAFVRLVVGSESKTNKQKCDQSDVKWKSIVQLGCILNWKC
jgi:hypothetical protein